MKLEDLYSPEEMEWFEEQSNLNMLLTYRSLRNMPNGTRRNLLRAGVISYRRGSRGSDRSYFITEKGLDLLETMNIVRSRDV